MGVGGVGEMGGYRKSIYFFNALLLVLLGAFAVCAALALKKPWLELFEISPGDPSLLYVFVGTGAQALCIFVGFLGVCLSSRPLLQIYWATTLVLLAADVAVGLWWVARFAQLHRHFPARLGIEWRRSSEDATFCRRWREIETELGCCGVAGPDDYRIFNASQSLLLSANCSSPAAGAYPPSCFDPERNLLREFGCSRQLLRWLQEEADVLFIVGYGLLFLLKAVYVFILRKELSELVKEIFHGRHKHLGHSWVDDSTPALQHALYEALPNGSGSGPSRPLDRNALSCDELGAVAKSRRLSFLPSFPRRGSTATVPEEDDSESLPMHEEPTSRFQVTKILS